MLESWNYNWVCGYNRDCIREKFGTGEAAKWKEVKDERVTQSFLNSPKSYFVSRHFFKKDFFIFRNHF